MTAVAGQFHAVCTSGCHWRPAGSWQEVVPPARAHEALTGHRVHVTDAARSSLWPREMWAAA